MVRVVDPLSVWFSLLSESESFEEEGEGEGENGRPRRLRNCISLPFWSVSSARDTYRAVILAF